MDKWGRQEASEVAGATASRMFLEVNILILLKFVNTNTFSSLTIIIPHTKLIMRTPVSAVGQSLLPGMALLPVLRTRIFTMKRTTFTHLTLTSIRLTSLMLMLVSLHVAAVLDWDAGVAGGIDPLLQVEDYIPDVPCRQHLMGIVSLLLILLPTKQAYRPDLGQGVSVEQACAAPFLEGATVLSVPCPMAVFPLVLHLTPELGLELGQVWGWPHPMLDPL